MNKITEKLINSNLSAQLDFLAEWVVCIAAHKSFLSACRRFATHARCSTVAAEQFMFYEKCKLQHLARVAREIGPAAAQSCVLGVARGEGQQQKAAPPPVWPLLWGLRRRAIAAVCAQKPKHVCRIINKVHTCAIDIFVKQRKIRRSERTWWKLECPALNANFSNSTKHYLLKFITASRKWGNKHTKFSRNDDEFP